MYRINSRRGAGIPALAGILLLSSILSVLHRQDINWDLCNYHLYNPFALLDGRLSRDLYVAGIQSYLNPFLDVPYFLVSVRLFPSMPRTVAFLAGLPYGILVILVIEAAGCFPRNYFPAGRIGRWCAVMIGISGTTVWAEVGTTFGDMPIAILVIGGILPLLRLAARPIVPCGPWLLAAGWSGLLIGLAVGLKLTAAVFALPLALSVALSTPQVRCVLPSCALVAAGGIIGFTVAFGWWGWTVWQTFGSPFFPLLNDLFHSPWMPAMSGRDPQYLPAGMWQTVFFPFSWLMGHSGVVAEHPVRDPRFALAWLSVALIAGIAVAAWRMRGDHLRHVLSTVACGRAMLLLLVFATSSFALWEWYFGILRYILPLEALSGVVILAGLKALLLLFRRQSIKLELISLATVVAVVIAGSTYWNWGRAKTWGQEVFTIEAPVLPDGSRVIASTGAVSFVLPFLRGKDLTFVGMVGVPPEALLSDRIAERLSGGRPVYALTLSEEGITTLQGQGWETIRDQCVPVRNPTRRGVLLCPVRRAAPLVDTRNGA
jgi:hypothetical protein